MNNTELLAYVRAEIQRIGSAARPLRPVRPLAARAHGAIAPLHRRQQPGGIRRPGRVQRGMGQGGSLRAAVMPRVAPSASPPDRLMRVPPPQLAPPARQARPARPGRAAPAPIEETTPWRSNDGSPSRKAEAGRLGGKATVGSTARSTCDRSARPAFRRSGRKFGFMGGSGRGALPLAQPQREAARPRRLPRIAVRGALGQPAPDDRRIRTIRPTGRIGRVCDHDQRGTQGAPQGGGAKAARTRRINAEAGQIHEQSLDRITDLACNGPDGRQLLRVPRRSVARPTSGITRT